MRTGRLCRPCGGVLSVILILCASFLPQNIFAVHPQSAALTIRIGPRDIWPPAAITDLEAVPSSIKEGEALLLWTAPSEDYISQTAQDPVKEYFVRYATFSVLDVAGDTTAWWNNAADAINEPFPPQHKGSPESFILTGLEPGATFYFAIKSRDEFVTNISSIDVRAPTTSQARALVLDLPPPVVTGLSLSASSTSLTLSWSASTAPDVANYRIYWDSSAPQDVFVATVTVSSATTSYTFTDLVPGNTYFFYVTALDRGLPTFLGNVLESTPSVIVDDFPTAAGPTAPSNLVALSISTNSITWQWQDNSSNESGFRLYSSTGGLIASTGAVSGVGGIVQFTETNLIPGANYSRFVRAFNLVGESLNSNTTDRFTLANPPVATLFQLVSKTSVTVSWSANFNFLSTVYEVQYSTDSGFGSFSSVTVTALSALIQSLRSETTYYVRVRARNGEGILTGFDATVSTVTLPFIVEGLTAVGSDQTVTLDWLDTPDPNFTGYFVYRTTNVVSGFTKVNLTAITTSTYVDSGLTNGTTYFYRVTIFKDDGRESPPSVIVSAIPRKAFPPQEPTGIVGMLGSDDRFTIRWTAVTMDVMHSTRAELVDYRIYKSSAMEGPFVLRDVVPSTQTKWTSTELVPPSVWYYVKATDLSGNFSLPSMRVFADKTDPKMAAGSADETMQIVFSGSEMKFFSAETNSFGEDIFVKIDRKSEEEQGNTLTSYEIKALGADTLKEVKDLGIFKPVVPLQFRYIEGINGALLPAGTKLPRFTGNVKDVGIFWHNGVEFVKFGGRVNEEKGTVSIRTAKPLGKFQVRKVLRASEFTLNQLTPRKIFTPNGDGVNDEIILFVENPKESVIAQAKIYDITGAEVADFEQGIVAGQAGIISLKWNGRDRNGEIVRSGVYIYQVQAEGKVINGTIVVAR